MAWAVAPNDGRAQNSAKHKEMDRDEQKWIEQMIDV